MGLYISSRIAVSGRFYQVVRRLYAEMLEILCRELIALHPAKPAVNSTHPIQPFLAAQLWIHQQHPGLL